MTWLPDLLLPLLFLIGVLAIGVFHFGSRRTEASPALDGWSAGLSLTITSLTLLAVFIPGEAYEIGLRFLLPLLLAWVCIPLLGSNILPGLSSEAIGSPLRYLALRFHPQVAVWSGGLLLAGRLLITSLALACLARMVSRGTSGIIAGAWFVMLPGFFATLFALYAPRGISTLQGLTAIFMFTSAVAGVLLLLPAVQGADHLWDTAQQLDRAVLIDPPATLAEAGSAWILIPCAILLPFCCLLVDESFVAALRTARQPRHIRFALVFCFVLVSLWVAAQTLLGMGLAVYYSDHPRSVRPQWIANVERITRRSCTDPLTQTRNLVDPVTGEVKIGLLTGFPERDPTYGEVLLDWNRPDHEITLENLPRLIAEKRLLHPNHHRPLESAAEVLTADGNAIDPAKLAIYRLGKGTARNEMVLHRRATEELWPHFVSQISLGGFRGLAIASLLAALLSLLISGIEAVASLGRQLLPVRDHDAGRALAGAAITMVALPVEIWLYMPGHWLLFLFACTLVPVAALILLGLTSRFATASVAGIALITGCLWTFLGGVSLLVTGPRPDAGFSQTHVAAAIPFAFLTTWCVGQLGCLVAGRKMRRGESAGLVLGEVPIGVLRPEEADPEIEVPETAPARTPAREPDRWR